MCAMPDSWIESFVECLNGGRIINNRLNEAIVLKDPNLPSKIYKYRCVNDRSRQNLMEDTIWLASPDAYNDPYDCVFTVSEEEILPVLRQTLNEELARILGGNSPADMDPNHADRLLAEALEKMRSWRGATKICSFSAASDIILMWSHYADHHRGFCIEYDLETLEPQHYMRKNIYPVIYSPHLYSLTTYVRGLASADRSEFQVNEPLLGVLHKYEGWEYEHEWRALFFTDRIAPDHVHAKEAVTKRGGDRQDVPSRSMCPLINRG
jgi:Protein of unknown function (DUF2971)